MFGQILRYLFYALGILLTISVAKSTLDVGGLTPTLQVYISESISWLSPILIEDFKLLVFIIGLALFLYSVCSLVGSLAERKGKNTPCRFE